MAMPQTTLPGIGLPGTRARNTLPLSDFGGFSEPDAQFDARPTYVHRL
jgi:hypothetical protein